MNQKPGRTPKVSTQKKIALVDRYFITSTDGNTALLKKHGIYRNLSDYAKSLHYPLEPYDFSRDNHVRDHIDQLIANSAQEPHILSGMPTYEPLDVTALMMNGREHIENTLRDREAYFAADPGGISHRQRHGVCSGEEVRRQAGGSVFRPE